VPRLRYLRPVNTRYAYCLRAPDEYLDCFSQQHVIRQQTVRETECTRH